MASEHRNVYLDQVVAQQEQLQQDLRAKRVAPAARLEAVPAQEQSRAPAAYPSGGGAGVASSQAVDVRVTGFGRWKTVVVPPNAYVVHTRRGRTEPLHVGLGTSFRYNPATDSYLVVPGAMQTILISAFSICRELQGLLVQAYVQWIIQDFAVAYRKLDFSDVEDPMRLVNIQLREQAEAAIKDKVATMSIVEVLSDKQPIIEELTARLRGVAEGEGGTDTGLGLRIVTVQIKEAVVSSARLWESLQKPYRSEQAQIARLAEVAAETAIGERELTAERQRETQQMANTRELAEVRARDEAAAFDRETTERARRAQLDEENSRALAELRHATTLHELNLERERHDQESEIGRLRIERDQLLKRLTLDGELAMAGAEATAHHERDLLDVERERARAQIENERSPVSVQARLVDSLPDIVERMPKPAELRAVTIGGTNATTVSGLVTELAAVIAALQSALSNRPPS